uniref:Uncharacterized protein n=1 Tax=viral metagenome TaxID=1070528 RepID=A0A6M3KZ03_9ZZZZ
MAAKLTYVISPLEHGMASEFPSLHIPGTWSPDMLNTKVEQHSLKKRWGYVEDRNLGSGVQVYNIAIYQKSDGTRYTLYFTNKDAVRKEIAGGKTFSYITNTYTTGSITDITTTVVTGQGTTWVTDGMEAGDRFILDTDHITDEEPDSDWATVSSVDSETQVTLTASYGGTTGAMAPPNTYKIRRVYSVPPNERWAYAVVDDKFCFTNGYTRVQYYDGSTYAADLNATYADSARYCIEYANRLILADLTNESVSARDPYMIRWSKEGDPTDFTDSTAGTAWLIDTDDYITGLGKAGSNIFVYKRDSIYVGNRTGEATAPIAFIGQRRGIGCVSPYSIVEVLGTNVFLGRDDFYMMDGDMPVSIGADTMRYKIFDLVDETEIQNVWGVSNILESEVLWVANTSGGKYAFVWNYQNKEWYMYQWADDIIGSGRGAI